MQELIDGLMEELAAYEKIFELTVSEREAYANKDSERFMSILSERLNLMNSITEFSTRLKPMRDRWIEKKEDFPEEFNCTVVDLVTRIKEKMNNILELEKIVIDEKNKQDKEVAGVLKSKAIKSYKTF